MRGLLGPNAPRGVTSLARRTPTVTHAPLPAIIPHNRRDSRRRATSGDANDANDADANPENDPLNDDPELEELLRVAVDRIKRKRAGLPEDDDDDQQNSATAQENNSALLSRLRGQMRLQAARDDVRQEAKEGAERLRKLGAELERELDEALKVEKFRAELEGGAALDSANAQLDELERQLEEMKEAARRGREEQEAWEEGAAAARSKGLFFGSLHEGPLSKKRREAFKEEVKRRKAEAEERAKGLRGGGGGGSGGGGGGNGGGNGGGGDANLSSKFSNAPLSPAYVPAQGADPSAVAAAIARQRLVASAAEREANNPWRRGLTLAMAVGLLSLVASAPPQAELWRLGACASIAAYVAAASVGAGGSGVGGEGGGAVRRASERRLREVFGEEEDEGGGDGGDDKGRRQ